MALRFSDNEDIMLRTVFLPFFDLARIWLYKFSSLQSFAKYLRLTLLFNGFLLVLTKYLFWQEDWALGYHSMRLDTFLIFLKSFGNS